MEHPTDNATWTSTPIPVDDKCLTPFGQGIAIIVINLVLVVLGTCGNFLIIFAVLKTPRLRKRVSNFLLLSLAVADLLVTLLAQPLNSISMSFKTIEHRCIPEVDFAYDIAGNFSFFCSVFHLSAISIDRALVVTKPHQHQEMMSKKGLKIMLFVCWGSAVTFVCLRVPFASTLMLSVAVIVANYIIISVSYSVILYHITHEKPIDPLAPESRATSRDALMERRVAGTISIIILFFSICSLPLLAVYITAKKGVLRNMGSISYMWARTLALSNSSMNFIVYSFRIHHFRTAYLKILRRVCLEPRQLFSNKPTSSCGSTLSRNKTIMELGCPTEVRTSSYNLKNTNTARLSSSSKEDDSCKNDQLV